MKVGETYSLNTRDAAVTANPIMPEGPPSTATLLTARDPTRIADRYDVQRLLGRGGMASVYRALDTQTGRTVALKLLSSNGGGITEERSVELLEREFHTLVQLAHPRVVQAYDYGVDGGAHYYTMELLDGGDLQELSPMPWRQVCTAAYEICSALSLLHSRRLVHRDLTPRNIRRTTDGKAKLIDFGLLSPMGPAGLIAGTPPFVAPELLNVMSLDGRSDLFSLGATLYFALTGRLAYSANRIERLRDAWRSSPAAPSRLIEGIPTALDDVILAMLRIDAGSRPKSAAEVMDRLLPLLDARPDDDLRVASAYLTAPRLVGREDALAQFRKQLVRAARRQGGGFVLSGEPGTGRSRMLDAFVLEAKLIGATTIRAGAAGATGRFGVAAALAKQLHTAAPGASWAAAQVDPKACALLFGVTPDAASPESEPPASLVDISDPSLDRSALQAALRGWILEFANRRPLAIAVDDVDQIDEPSASLLASLTWEAPTSRLVYAVTLDPGARGTAATALAVVQKHAASVELSPLSPQETTELLGSVFGDVPNLHFVSHRLHALCVGRPRECMALAQFLVDRGAITYAGGSFTLPTALPEGLLPASIQEALDGQVALLSPLSRRIGALLALGFVGTLSRAQLMRLDASPAAIDAALDELLSVRLLTGDTTAYGLSHGSLARLLTSTLTEAQIRQIHGELAEIYERSEVHPLAIVHHKLMGPRPEEGVDYFVARTQDSEARTEMSMSAAIQLGTERTGPTLEVALKEATRLSRPRREQQAIWVMLAGVSAQGEDPAYYFGVPPEWLEQLKRDSGWNDWQSLDPTMDPATRAMFAVGAAAGRYGETPEAERVLSPPDAIKQLVSYAVFSIAVSVRVFDLKLMASIPPLLEPFAPLNPMVAAMLGNARGTLLNGEGKREEAREVFLGVYRQLDDVSGADLAYVNKVRAAISQTLAEIDASLGVQSTWTQRLEEEEQDSNQRVGARYIRKVEALQQGDWERAELHRQEAELVTLQSKARPMFSTLGQELEAHAIARDLTGLKQVRTGIHAMAARYPGWVPVMHVADAHYLRLCGDLASAEAAAELGRSTGTDGDVVSPWVFQAVIVEIEILVEMGRADEALRLGESVLLQCESSGMRYFARGLGSAVAFAEAKLGRTDQAMDRVNRIIAEQLALGVTGLQLGRSYQLAARIAMLAGDVNAFRRFVALTAEQYRPGQSSVLGALYERMLEEARQAGFDVAAINVDPAARIVTDQTTSTLMRITTALAGCTDAEERSRRALGLLCDGDPPNRGHLFLLSDRGLVLAASNTVCDFPAELNAFANACIEDEVQKESAMTAVLDTGAFESALDFSQWRDPSGRRHQVVPLGVTMDNAFHVVGVAVFEDEHGRGPGDVRRVAEALAKHLVESGDVRSICAA